MLSTIVLIAAASWLSLAPVAGVLIGRIAKQADEMDRAAYPVPAPTVTQDDIDATWLDAWPTDRMPQQQVDRLFDDIVALEGPQS